MNHIVSSPVPETNPAQKERDKTLAVNRMLAVILAVILLAMLCTVGSCVNLFSFVPAEEVQAQ